jgi:hypothetical protein
VETLTYSSGRASGCDSPGLLNSIRTTLCPEPYIRMRVEPGREAKWRIDYQFYTLTPR